VADNIKIRYRKCLTRTQWYTEDQSLASKALSTIGDNKEK